MISVDILRSENGKVNGFVTKGHAGYAEEGYDIICAAVSALTINTCNSLEALTDDDMEIEQAEDGGYLKLVLHAPVSEQAQILLDSLVLGLTMIENSYGSDFLDINQ